MTSPTSGRCGAQTDWMIDLLADARDHAVNIVTTPEEMPVAETIELVEPHTQPRRRCTSVR